MIRLAVHHRADGRRYLPITSAIGEQLGGIGARVIATVGHDRFVGVVTELEVNLPAGVPDVRSLRVRKPKEAP